MARRNEADGLPQARAEPAARRARIEAGAARIGIVGLGYVGMPLALAAARRGSTVLGVDIDPAKIEHIAAGRSYLSHVPAEAVAAAAERFSAGTDFARLAEADAILICVPTPLDRHREPDLSFVTGTARAIVPHLRPGQLVVLESTTYPGTTTDILRPILESGGLRSGQDFFLAYSPEREDPGNAHYSTERIPKVVGGDGDAALALAAALYRGFVDHVVPVRDTATAEAVKLTENIFRAVNIALVNELKLVYDAMGIDVWDVIEAAATKPFGFMPFYPGPGLGGHCIPIDPFYLAWKAREYDIPTRFIELAGEINTAMPRLVVERLALALDERAGRGLRGAAILVLGIAYKKNVNDMRESPALRLIELIEARGARAAFHDPLVPVIPRTREHAALEGRHSVPLEADALSGYDAVLIATDHDAVDYGLVVRHARMVVDTRNACHRAGLHGPTIVKA